MKKYLLTNLLFVFICSHAVNVIGQSTVFTYQGSLQNSGSQVNDSYDFEFALFDAKAGGTQIGATLTMNGVPVIQGNFSVELNFGNQFPGANRYLEIRTRRSFTGATFTTLFPRQLVASTPYAIKSLSSENAAQLGGTPAANFLQAVNRNNTLNGDGSSGTPLGVAIPLTLTGSVAGQGIIHANNTNELGNALFGTINGITFPCASCAAIRGINNGYGNGIYGSNNSGGDDQAGVKGESALGTGVIGVGGLYGLRGMSTINEGIGVSGKSPNGIGVRGESAGASAPLGNAAVFGINTSTGAAIHGFSVNGYAGYFSGKTFLSGNVGIGTGSPQEKLDVLGDSRFVGNVSITGTLNATIPGGSTNYIQNTTSQQPSSNFSISGNGVVGGSLSVGNAGTNARLFLNRAAANPANSADINFYSAGQPDFALGTSQGSADPSDFSIYNYGTSSNALTIRRPNGFLGLGTHAPNTNVHMVANAPQGFAIQMENLSTAKRLYIGNYGTTGGGNHWPGRDSANTSFLYSENNLVFTTPGGIYFSGSTTAEHMRIGANGIVSIPTALTIGSNAVIPATGEISFNGLVIGTGGLKIINLSGAGGGSTLCAAGTAPFTIGFCSSSYRYKTNVSPYRSGLDVIGRLQPITFDWKRGALRDMGLGAEDVEKVAPELVFFKDGNVEGVRYEKLGVVLINAVKEQQMQIESQKNEIDGLKATLVEQRAMIAVLRTAVCKANPDELVCKTRP